SVHDPDMPKEVCGSLHNYYIAKMLKLVRPGGVVAAITSRWTMDSKSDEHRIWIAEEAHLIEAIRLPTKTFSDYAGCDVVTDVLWFQRRTTPLLSFPRWVYTTDTNFTGPRGEEQLHINDALTEGKTEVLGQYVVKTGAYAPTLH